MLDAEIRRPFRARRIHVDLTHPEIIVEAKKVVGRNDVFLHNLAHGCRQYVLKGREKRQVVPNAAAETQELTKGHVVVGRQVCDVTTKFIQDVRVNQ